MSGDEEVWRGGGVAGGWRDRGVAGYDGEGLAGGGGWRDGGVTCPNIMTSFSSTVAPGWPRDRPKFSSSLYSLG